MVRASSKSVNSARDSVRWACLVILSFLYGSLAWSAERDEVTVRGFQHTMLDHALVAKAVARVNDVLQGTGIRFAPSWLRSTGDQEKHDVVPLYLVESRAEAASTPAAVPEGCYCVFVNPAFLASWIAFNSKGASRMELDRAYFLTFILLHEAGHIKEGTPAAAFKEGEISQLNVDPDKAKVSERRADEFAAELLRRLAYTTPANSASIEANFVLNELIKLSWNMQAFRTLDEFGSYAVGKPSLYFDPDYTHPNMALRILRTNHLIHDTEATRQLLQAFEEARQRGANPKPLYERR